jgi:sugar phosphate isomerase/epimerase
VPPGFPRNAAWRQLIEFLQSIGPLAEEANITIAIEPLNHEESNIVNSVSEGLRLVEQVNHPRIQLLVDFYHLRKEKEDPAIILQAGSAIRHLHFAKVAGRVFPRDCEDEFISFFRNLQKIGYSGRCSIEAYSENLLTEAPQALRVLREASERSLEWSK